MTSLPSGSLRRAMLVMRILANAGARGASLSDITRQTHLPHPTVHRLLGQMVEERMVHRIASERRYALGTLTFELGLAAAQQFDIGGLLRPTVSKLAQDTGDTAYLTVRSGSEAVCVDCRQGSSPIRVVTLKIGTRRPLGIGAGGLAILAGLPDEERDTVISMVAPELESDWATTVDDLRELVAGTHEDGHALIHNRVFNGVSAIGRPIRDSLGRPIAAVSVATVNGRMQPSRMPALTAQLADAVHAAEAALTSLRYDHLW